MNYITCLQCLDKCPLLCIWQFINVGLTYFDQNDLYRLPTILRLSIVNDKYNSENINKQFVDIKLLDGSSKRVKQMRLEIMSVKAGICSIRKDS